MHDWHVALLVAYSLTAFIGPLLWLVLVHAPELQAAAEAATKAAAAAKQAAASAAGVAAGDAPQVANVSPKPEPVTLLAALLALGKVSAVGTSMGALHSLASLSKHAGDSALTRPWILFYLVRPFTGAGVAIATYLLLVSGLGGFSVQGELALLAWAALAGLYSQPALEKLKDVFAALLNPSKPSQPDAEDSAASAKVDAEKQQKQAATPQAGDAKNEQNGDGEHDQGGDDGRQNDEGGEQDNDEGVARQGAKGGKGAAAKPKRNE